MNTQDNILIQDEYIDTLCGDLIAEGTTRSVFECRINPQFVVKIIFKNSNDSGANRREWEFYKENSFARDVIRWLSPCTYLSPGGLILIQQRVDPLPKTFELPDMLPYFLEDIKRSNFGLLEGELVCVDYANTCCRVQTKLKKVKWRES